MTDSKILVAVLLAVCLTTAGCTYPSTSENSLQFDGTVERVDGQFRMTGEIRITGTDARDIDTVRIVLYDDNRTAMKTFEYGPLSSRSGGEYPSNHSVNITTDSLPAYVVTETSDANIPSEAFHWKGGQYTEYWAEGDEGRFPSTE